MTYLGLRLYRYFTDRRNDFGTVRLHLRCRKRARPRAHLHHRPRRFPHPDVHARGHLRHGEGDHHRPAARARQPGGAREHLPLGHAPRGGAGGRGRGHPPLHELRRPHAHRLRRIPGVLAGRHREALRRRGHVPVHLRRQQDPLDARGEHAHPGAHRRRHRHAAGPVRPLPRHPRVRGARRGLLQRLGASLPGGPYAPRSDALRHRAGRHAPGCVWKACGGCARSKRSR